MTRDDRNKLDGGFAERIARHDESVVADIQQAYGESLRKKIESFRGPRLNEHDIDDVIAQAVNETWTSYVVDRGLTVRAFLFRVAKRRTQDRLRRNYRRQTAELEAAKISAITLEGQPAADELFSQRESYVAVIQLVDAALDTLTDRQRTAFKRRFAAGDRSGWAKLLEQETGIPAKQWRKASDDALKKVRAYLNSHGVRFSRQEGHYEVA